jgi:hypothetical protein
MYFLRDCCQKVEACADAKHANSTRKENPRRRLKLLRISIKKKNCCLPAAAKKTAVAPANGALSVSSLLGHVWRGSGGRDTGTSICFFAALDSVCAFVCMERACKMCVLSHRRYRYIPAGALPASDDDVQQRRSVCTRSLVASKKVMPTTHNHTDTHKHTSTMQTRKQQAPYTHTHTHTHTSPCIASKDLETRVGWQSAFRDGARISHQRPDFRYLFSFEIVVVDVCSKHVSSAQVYDDASGSHTSDAGFSMRRLTISRPVPPLAPITT